MCPIPHQGLYIKAKRPEAALKMYRDARLWNDALRVAEQYLPTKVGEVQMDLLNGGAAGGGGAAAPSADVVINKARNFERNNDYARAIEAYLSLTAQVCIGRRILLAGWQWFMLAMLGPIGVKLSWFCIMII